MSRASTVFSSLCAALLVFASSPLFGQAPAQQKQSGSVKISVAEDAISACEELYPELKAYALQDTWITFDNTASSNAKRAIVIEAIDVAGNSGFYTNTAQLGLLKAGETTTVDFERKFIKFRVYWRQRGALGIWWPHKCPEQLLGWYEAPAGSYVYYAVVKWDADDHCHVQITPKPVASEAAPTAAGSR